MLIALLINYCMEDGIGIDNATDQKFGADGLWDFNGPMYKYTPGKSGGKYATFQINSALLGGSAGITSPCQCLME